MVKPAMVWKLNIVCYNARGNQAIVSRRSGIRNFPPKLLTTHVMSRNIPFAFQEQVPELAEAQYLRVHMQHARQHRGTAPASTDDDG
jgi:hypothetical protein